MAKIEDLNKKIGKSEGYLLKQRGDENFKNKKWKEAVEEFKGAKDNLQKNGAKKEEIEEIEKKLKKAEKKAAKAAGKKNAGEKKKAEKKSDDDKKSVKADKADSKK